jgi:hypothetical protein
MCRQTGSSTVLSSLSGLNTERSEQLSFSDFKIYDPSKEGYYETHRLGCSSRRSRVMGTFADRQEECVP